LHQDIFSFYMQIYAPYKAGSDRGQ
jgi:hypothetical protein